MNERQQLGENQKAIRNEWTLIEFEKSLMNERIKELNVKLKECNNLRESDILINEIDTIESVLVASLI